MKIFLVAALVLSSFTLFANDEKKHEEHAKEKEACLKEHKDLKDKALEECVMKKVEEEKKHEVKK
jgi:hypothetical protein